MKEKAVFAAGCFWGVEDSFMGCRGVISTTVGYTGGRTNNPSYEDVCSDGTGHAEAVLLEFDTSKTTYEKLVIFFFSIHDPTTKNSQGPDLGSQYRSAIFYSSEEQKKTAERVKSELNPKFNGKIVTEISPAQEFWKAEEYHQKYRQKRGGSCRF